MMAKSVGTETGRPVMPPETLRRLIENGPSPGAVEGLLRIGRPATVHVERVHFRGSDTVQIQFRAVNACGLSELVLAEWIGDGVADVAADEARRLAKPRRGQIDGRHGAVAPDQPTGLLLRRPGFDAKLPGLQLLYDRPFAVDCLARLGVTGVETIDLAAHRLGKRAVLRIVADGRVVFARLRPVTSGSGGAGYALHRQLHAALDRSDSLRVPQPVGYDDALGCAVFEALTGTPPEFAGLAGFRGMHAISRGLAALQAARLDLAAHRIEDEIEILDGWSSRLAPVFPKLSATLTDPLSALRDELRALPPDAGVPCHRDFHEGQILIDGARAAFLDFDTLRSGDRALDIGNLQAHLVLAGQRDGRSRAAFINALAQAVPDIPLARIAVWRRAALLRLAMIYGFSSEPRETVVGLVRAAAS